MTSIYEKVRAKAKDGTSADSVAGVIEKFKSDSTECPRSTIQDKWLRSIEFLHHL